MKADRILAGGIFGKLPSYGDFLHRRLPSHFVEAWNAWLSQALIESRKVLDDRWTDAYLTSPPWRFLLEPGTVGEEGWIGVLASSVDQVHRCYPITVAVALPEETRLCSLTGEIDPVFDLLERISLQLIDGSLNPDAVTDQIDELTRLVGTRAAPASIFTRGGPEWLMLDQVPSQIAVLAARWRAAATGGGQPLSVWWHKAWGDFEPASIVTVGLPIPEIFVSFLDGAWTDRAWTDKTSRGPST